MKDLTDLEKLQVIYEWLEFMAMDIEYIGKFKREDINLITSEIYEHLENLRDGVNALMETVKEEQRREKESKTYTLGTSIFREINARDKEEALEVFKRSAMEAIENYSLEDMDEDFKVTQEKDD